MIFIETNRLRLRNVRSEDADIMYDYRNNEICARYQRGQNREYGKILELIERRKQDVLSVDAPFMLAVAFRQTDEMVGEIVVIPREGTITMGYTFHYRHHRKGYAYEALSTLLEVLHNQYPQWQFVCFTEPENIPSRNLLKKLGYTELGYDQTEGAIRFGKWLTAPKGD